MNRRRFLLAAAATPIAVALAPLAKFAARTWTSPVFDLDGVQRTTVKYIQAIITSEAGEVIQYSFVGSDDGIGWRSLSTERMSSMPFVFMTRVA